MVFSHLELAAVRDDALLRGGAALGAAALESLDDIHALNDLAEDDVLAIEPWAWDGGDEELGAVSVLAGVCHGKKTWAGVLVLEVLISELLAVDGLATGAVHASEVTTLDHEVWDDTVEWAALVVEWLARAAVALLTSAEGTEVLGSLWNIISIKLEDDAASVGATDRDVKVHTRIAHGKK